MVWKYLTYVRVCHHVMLCYRWQVHSGSVCCVRQPVWRRGCRSAAARLPACKDNDTRPYPPHAYSSGHRMGTCFLHKYGGTSNTTDTSHVPA